MMQTGGGSGSGSGSGTGSGSGSGTQAMQYPESCMDAGNGAQVADGEYTLYVGGDETKPWKAYCHNGDEFLSVTDYRNYGLLVAGGWATNGTTVRTAYEKLRIDPQTLTIDISDQTFTRSEGSLWLQGQEVTSMPLGVGIGCAELLVYGVGSIDLTGSPFKIVSTFGITGTGIGPSLPDGDAVFVDDDQRVEAYAGGECGVAAPTGMTGAPVNKIANGWQVKVEWFAKP